MPYGLAAQQLLVRYSTASPNLLVPSIPYSAFTFVALPLKYTAAAGTITAHYLYITGDMSEVDPLAFCKPIPHTPRDRDALIKAASSGDPKFFL